MRAPWLTALIRNTPGAALVLDTLAARPDARISVNVSAPAIRDADWLAMLREHTDKPVKYLVLSHYHAVRVLGAAAFEAALDRAWEECGRVDILVNNAGFGMAGDELKGKPGDFLWAFACAHEAGLRITVHAGEWAGPQSVHDAVEFLSPERVGHGVRAIEDAARLLDAGADKVAVNTAALSRPELLTEIHDRLGAQCTILALDAARRCLRCDIRSVES